MPERITINHTGYPSVAPTRLKLTLRRALSSQASLLLLLIIASLGYLQIVPNILLVALLALISFKEFYQKIDRGLPLLELANLIAVLQWNVGPVLSYFFKVDHFKYHMYVDEPTFFSYALPATCGFTAAILGCGLVVDQRPIVAQKRQDFYFNYGVYLVIIAFAAELTSSRVPSSIQFFFFLLSQLRYVAAMYFLLSGHRYRFIATIIACSSLFVKSANAGMFHDLLLWLALIFCIWFPTAKWLHYRKPLVFGLAALMVFTIQVVKQDYRDRLRAGEKPSLFVMAFDYLSPSGRAWDKDILSLALVRLNQGWIISAVMNHVPSQQEYGKGATVVDAVVALAPRFLIPTKVGAGGRESFRKYTGLAIGNETSMCISVLGEAYANFGEYGGIFFMIAFGVFIAVYYSQVLKWTAKHPDFLFWIPLIFYQAIKAETDMVVIVNQIVKGSLVAFAGYLAMHRFFPPAMFQRGGTYPSQLPLRNLPRKS
jgi:hypothetical protein